MGTDYADLLYLMAPPSDGALGLVWLCDLFSAINRDPDAHAFSVPRLDYIHDLTGQVFAVALHLVSPRTRPDF